MCMFIVAMQHHVATLVGFYNIIQNVGTMVMMPVVGSYNIIQNVGTMVMLPVVGSYHIISLEHATVAGNM